MKHFISLKGLYSFLGSLMFICALLLVLDGFDIRDISTASVISYYVLIIIGFIGRGLIRMRQGREA